MEETDNRRPVIAITGASGYIGRNLMAELKKHADIIALSRNIDTKENEEHVTWRSCDLFSLKDAEEALEGADYALYLVHSMMPTSKLTQGRFEDMDVILADNFARAAEQKQVKQVVYLSGIIPEAEHLSRHLSSRLEVENILKSYRTPVTAIRAGLIVGPQGSSFPILAKLVKRLPVMVLPKWTQTKTHPIALADVLNSLQKSIGEESLYNRSIDVGGPDVMTYRKMMGITSKVMGKKRYAVTVPFFTVRLSRLWVSVTTGTPKSLVYPLIESLIHPMVADPAKSVKGISDGKISFEEAAENSLKESRKEQSSILARLKPAPVERNVRSVQRVTIPSGRDADWTARYYIKWLPKLLRPFVKVETTDRYLYGLRPAFMKRTFLELSYSKERSEEDRALYYITGGLLAQVNKGERGRLEFRKIPHTNQCIVAVHDYVPAMPWYFYQYTQAFIHLWIMNRFKKHLEKDQWTLRSSLQLQPES